MNKWTRVFEQTQKVPYAYSGNGQWVGYDDKESVAIKINYIKANNLGGGMIWSEKLNLKLIELFFLY